MKCVVCSSYWPTWHIAVVLFHKFILSDFGLQYISFLFHGKYVLSNHRNAEMHRGETKEIFHQAVSWKHWVNTVTVSISHLPYITNMLWPVCTMDERQTHKWMCLNYKCNMRHHQQTAYYTVWHSSIHAKHFIFLEFGNK